MGNSSLTEGNITKAMASFALPLILSGLLQQLFNWVDAFIVGNVEGELALGAIGATSITCNLFITVMTGFTSGLSVLSAQRWGSGDKDAVRELLHIFSLILGCLFLIVTLLSEAFLDELLQLLSTPPLLVPNARGYLRIILIGIPFLALYNTYAAALRGMGDSRPAFCSVLVSSVFNAALDVILVMLLGLGVQGAAAATVFSEVLMTLFIVLYAHIRHPYLRDAKIRAFRTGAGDGARFGLPPALQSGLSSLGSVLLQRFMNSFGELVVAAVTTAYRVDSLILLPVINFSSAIATTVAQNTGAGDRKRADKALLIGLILMSLVSLALTAFVLAFGKRLIAMFGLNAATVETGSGFFNAIAVCYVVFGLASAFRGYIEGLGDMLYSGAAAIAALLVRILCSYAFRPLWGWKTIAYAEVYSWAVMLLLYLARTLYKRRRPS